MSRTLTGARLVAGSRLAASISASRKPASPNNAVGRSIDAVLFTDERYPSVPVPKAGIIVAPAAGIRYVRFSSGRSKK